MERVKDRESIAYIDANSPKAVADFREAFWRVVSKKIKEHDQMVVLCIGTDRATGDSLGPLVGHTLTDGSPQQKIHVYGTLEKPVHAKNIYETVREIYNKHLNPMIVAIDASLGKIESIGYISMGTGSICPGAGINKRLPPVGDLFITGIVNHYSYGHDMTVLSNTRLNLVMKMASVIGKGILEEIKKI